MAKFSDLSIGIIILLLITIIIETYLIYKHHEENQHFDINTIDLNGDGIVSKSELKYILKQHLEKNKSPIGLQGLLKSARSGALRGGLMGLMTHGIEGALAGGLMLGIINPLVSGLEHKL